MSDPIGENIATWSDSGVPTNDQSVLHVSLTIPLPEGAVETAIAKGKWVSEDGTETSEKE